MSRYEVVEVQGKPRVLRQCFVQGAAITTRGRTKRERLIDEAVGTVAGWHGPWAARFLVGLRDAISEAITLGLNPHSYWTISIGAEFRRLNAPHTRPPA